MALDACTRCGDFPLFGTCPCRPFEVAMLEHDVSRRYDRHQRRWLDEIDHIEWHRIYAKGPDQAAQHVVERSDSDACEGISGTTHVLVRWTDDQHRDRHQLFVVYGELVPEYYSSEGERFELAQAKQADMVLKHLGLGYLPDALRPHTVLGRDYYSPERQAERAQRKREHDEWERKRHEREANKAKG